MRTSRRGGRLLLAILVVLGLVLAACGDGDDEAADEGDRGTAESTTTSTEPPPARGDADLVIWADDTRTPALKPFATEFGTTNGVKVDVVEVAGGSNFSRIRDLLQLAGPTGEGPDIIIGANDWIGELTKNGMLEAIDLGARAADYNKAAIDAFTLDGKLYGLPYAVENVALIRNTDLVPTAPATWEELEQTALKLKADGTVDVALAVQNSPADPFHNYPLFSALGGYVFGKNASGYNPQDLGIDSPGALAAATKFREWVDSGLINPEITYDIMLEKFATGKAPFAITGPWALSGDKGFKTAGVKYSVDPFPTIAGGTAHPFVGVQAFMVSSFAKNKLLARTFLLDFMGTDEAQLAMYEAGGRPPALNSAFAKAQDDPDVKGFGLAGAEGYGMPAIPEMASVWTAWTDAYTLIFQKKGDPQQAFKDAAAQIRQKIGG
ncbi:MAG TPA: maltose ABC transporter substrate-binding protein [Acidimicrobiales bacterium]|nr:maltose ABC transporter substrate-binding protein [Acidimicrobiales bacterium]